MSLCGLLRKTCFQTTQTGCAGQIVITIAMCSVKVGRLSTGPRVAQRVTVSTGADISWSRASVYKTSALQNIGSVFSSHPGRENHIIKATSVGIWKLGVNTETTQQSLVQDCEAALFPFFFYVSDGRLEFFPTCRTQNCVKHSMT